MNIVQQLLRRLDIAPIESYEYPNGHKLSRNIAFYDYMKNNFRDGISMH